MAYDSLIWWGIDVGNAPSYKEATKFRNTLAEITTFSRYANIGSHRYEFEGVPEWMDERSIRESLLWYPLTAFFVVGDQTVCLPAVPGGQGYNAQGAFADGFAYAKNGKVYHLNFDMIGSDNPVIRQTPGPKVDAEFTGVCIRENDLCLPFINRVIYHTDMVADALRAFDNQRNLLKHPIGIYTTQEQKNTWQRWFKQLDDNEPVIFFNKNKPRNGGEPDKAEVVDLVGDHDFIKPTTEYVDWIDARFFAECGIQNGGQSMDKKGENLLNAEVHSADDVTSMVTQGLVDYINNQIKAQGVNKLPGMENFRCVARKGRQQWQRLNRQLMKIRLMGLLPGHMVMSRYLNSAYLTRRPKPFTMSIQLITSVIWQYR